MKKKILIVADSSTSLIDFRGRLIEALGKNNEVNVFTPRIIRAGIKERLLTWGVIIHENSLNGSNVSVASDVKYIFHLYKTIKSVKPDVVFSYAFKPVIYAGLIAAICRIKYVTPMLTGLGNTFQENNSKQVIKKITRNLLKLSLNSKKDIRIILHNKDDRETLLHYGIIGNKSQIFVVNGSGVDLDHYSYSRPDVSKLTFLMVARLINAKGIREFYEASLILSAKFPDITFKLAGPYDNNVDAIDKKLYDEIRSGRIIDYVGEVEDVRSLIQECSVVVLPSYREGVPRCILEAMAIGRPVITTDTAGCKETVSDSPNNPNGFLVPVKDVAGLVNKMEYFITNKDDIVRFGLNGRKYADEKFDVWKINQQMLQILEAD